MKTDIFYIGIAVLVMAAAAYAVTQGNIVTFMNNTNVVITTFCSQSNGDPCTSSQSCALTSYYPNLSFVAENKTMLFSKVGFFNTTLGVLNVTGDYPSFVNCTDGTINRTADATFRVVVTLNESAIYERNTNVTLRGLCVNPNGNRCTSSESCALTAYNPDSSIRVNKSSMTFEADGFFTYLMGVLTITGEYHSFMNCTDGTFNRSIDATFKVVLSVDQQFHTDINNTLSTLNKTVIDANTTLSTINKTVIDANTTLSTINKTVIDANTTLATVNKTVIDANVTLGTVNSSIINLNTTLLNESNYGDFSLRRISTEINNTKTLLKSLLDKQAELTAEEVFLITDSLVSINRLVEAMDNGTITTSEAEQKLGEIKAATQPVSAKAISKLTTAAQGSNNALYIIIILASMSMTGFTVYQVRQRAKIRPSVYAPTKIVKVKASDSILPVQKAKTMPVMQTQQPLTQYFGSREKKRPTNMKAHLKEIKQLYKEGIIDKATYLATRNRFLENMEIVKRNEPDRAAVRRIETMHGAKPLLWQLKPKSILDTTALGFGRRKSKPAKPMILDDKDYLEPQEFVELQKLLKQKTPAYRGWLHLKLRILTRKGRLQRRLAKLHKALNDNYSAFGDGMIDISTYLENREKLVYKLKELNTKMKALGRKQL